MISESNIFGISIRGIIAFIVISSLCGICVYLHTPESLGILKDISLVILTFYYVQKSTQGGTNDSKTNSNNSNINVTEPGKGG